MKKSMRKKLLLGLLAGVMTLSAAICLTACKERDQTKKLKYTLSEDGKSYIVSGMDYAIPRLGGRPRGTVNIPATYKGKPVTEIGFRAFRSCKLTSITIPDSVTSIGQEAFKGSDDLTSITIPDSVTSIGQEAFCACKGLTSAVIGNGVTEIEKETFDYCIALTSVTIGNSVTSIGPGAFSDCSKLKSVYYAGAVADWCRIRT